MRIATRPVEILSACVAVAALVTANAWATPLGSNIIVNGNAEADTGSTFSTTVVPTGWTTTSNFTAVRYDVGGSGELNTMDSGLLGGGANYFAGGFGNALATATQTINIGDLASSIDNGSLTAALSALIGGFDGQGDNMTIRATFFNGSNSALSFILIGPVSNVDRADDSTLLARNASAPVPVGARSVQILMTSTRLSGDYNDGYADNLSLILRGGIASVPEPSALALAGLGLLAIVVIRRPRTL